MGLENELKIMYCVYGLAPSILHNNTPGDTKETMKIIKHSNRCGGQDSKRVYHEYKPEAFITIADFLN
jgi:hypothetical protein